MQTYIFSGAASFVLRIALAAAVFATFGPAIAQANSAHELNTDDLKRVAAGEAVVRVEPAEGLADALVIGAVDIAAPRTVVWDVLVNCQHAAAVMPNLTSCKVLEAAPDGSSDVREHRIRWISLLPEIRSEFRSKYLGGKSIEFARTGGDMRALEGAWRIETLGKSTVVRLHYLARVGFGALIPGFAIRSALANDVPGFLNAIKTQALRDAKPLTIAR